MRFVGFSDLCHCIATVTLLPTIRLKLLIANTFCHLCFALKCFWLRLKSGMYALQLYLSVVYIFYCFTIQICPFKLIHRFSIEPLRIRRRVKRNRGPVTVRSNVCVKQADYVPFTKMSAARILYVQWIQLGSFVGTLSCVIKRRICSE